MIRLRDNNQAMKQLLFTLSTLLLILITPNHVFAALAPSITPTPSIPASSCPPIYNGGSICEQNKDFTLDKKILNPRTGVYVDTIESQELKIQTDHTAMFRLEITNLSKNTLHAITVTDILPSYMQFANASSQEVKTTATKITYQIPSLEKGKTHTITIETKVDAADALPENTVCLANQAEAKQGSKRASDIVSFCIEKFAPTLPTQTTNPSPQTETPKASKGGLTVYPAPQTNKAPNTGPESLAIIGLLPLAFAGFKLRNFRLS